jgi:AraC-like DNA-binding protein
MEVLEHMMYLRQGKLKQVLKVDALKSSTRVEIFKRVSIAREVLLSQTQESLDLSQLSRASCLSVPQLVRQFRAVYGKTPYQYLVNERLKRSAQLLSDTNIHVNEIANLCGFEDASAFSRAFKKYYQRQPTSYREQNRVNLIGHRNTN